MLKRDHDGLYFFDETENLLEVSSMLIGFRVSLHCSSYLTNGSDPFRAQWKGNPLTEKNLNQLLHSLCEQENCLIVIG